MSTTVESRVVEMRFDNGQFERNVSNTMSTLDKLKAKLNFSGSAKGLNDVNAAAKNVDMNGLARGVETVSAKFSALDVMAVTALANITNSAVNAGKRIVSALTIDPIKTGLQEYETQINAVQTIRANTESKGTTIDDVNAALAELNEYADKTIYNFTEMTRNIGTFTAAGVDLDTSVSAIQGIANLAAVSGSTSQQASTAMYQLSQALSTGTVRLQDWNSVVNAGMGGEVFQNALVRTAAVMAGASENVEAWRKENIDSFGSFRDSLTQGGWLTTEVLTETLNQFTLAAEEGSKEWEAYKKSLMDTGYTEKQAAEILKMANTATDAATKVKTFTQLWDVLKESAQSGWSQTWKLLIGDFEQAKGILTPLADFFTNIINKISDFRNNILEGALGMSFKRIGASIEKVAKPAEKAVETISDLGGIVDDVILGKFGNGVERIDKLTKAGLNYYEVQNKVNEKLGDSFRHTKEEIAAQNKLLGVQTKTNKSKADTVKIQANLTEKQLADLGATEDQIAAYNELADAAAKLGMPLEEFIEKMDEIDGRWLMIESFKNIGKGLIDVFKAIGAAWKDVFPPKSIEERSVQLFDMIAAVYKFSRSIAEAIYDGENLTDVGDKLFRTFKGVFAIFDLVTTIVGGGFKIAFKIVNGILGKFGLCLLDVTAYIGDAAVAFHDWFEETLGISKIVDGLAPILKNVAKFIGDLISSIKNSVWLGEFRDFIASIAEGLGNILSWILEIIGTGASLASTFAFTIIGKALNGLVRGLKAVFDVIETWMTAFGKSDLGQWFGSIFKNVPDTMANVGKAFSGGIEAVQKWVDKIKETEAFKTVAGWFKDASQTITDAISNITTKISEFNTSALMDRLRSLGDLMSGIANSLKGSELFVTIVGSISGAFDNLKEFVSGFKLPKFDLKNLTNFSKFAARFEGGKVTGFASAIGAFGSYVKDTAVLKAKNLFKSIFSVDWATFKSNAMASFADFWLKTGDKIKAAFDACKKVIRSIAEFIVGSEEVNLPNILGVVEKFLGIVVLIKVLKLLNTLAAPLDNVTDALDNVASSMKWEAIGGAFKAMAVALGTLTLCIVILASIPDIKQAAKAAGLLAGLMVIMTGAIIAMSIFVSKMDAGIDVAGAAGALLMIALSIMLLIATLKQIDGLNLQHTGRTFAILAGILLALTAGIKMIAKAGGSSFASVAAVLTLVTALNLILDVIESYDAFDWNGKSKAIWHMVDMLVILSLAINLASRGVKSGASASGLATLVLAMVISLKILVGVIEDFGSMDTDKLIKGGIAVAILMGVITVMLGVMEYLDKGYVLDKGQKSMNTFAGLATALLAVVASIWLLGKMDIDTLVQGGIAVAAALILFTGMIAVIGKSCSGLKMGVIITMLISMSVLMVEMAIIIRAMKNIPWETSLGSAAAMSLMMFTMAKVLGTLSKNNVKAGAIFKWIGAMAALGLVLGELAIVLRLVRGVAPTTAIGNAIALSALIGAMAGVLTTLAKHRNGAKSIYKWIGAMAAFALVMAELAIVLNLVKDVDPMNAIGNVLAIDILLAGMTLCMTTLTKHRNGAKSIYKWIGAMATFGLVVAELAIVLHLVKDIDPINALGNVAALTVLMIAMAGVLAVVKAIRVKKSSFVGIGALATVAASLFILVGVLHSMSGVENATTNAKALALLVGALSLCMLPLAVAGKMGWGAIVGAASLAGLMASMYIIVDVLSKMEGIANAKENATILANLVVALTACLIPLSLISILVYPALVAVAALALLMWSLKSVVSTLERMEGLENAKSNANVLIDLLTTMSDVMMSVGSLGFDAVTAVVAISGLINLVAKLGALATAIGWLSEHVDGLGGFIDSGIEIFKKLATGLGEIISGFGVGLTSGLPEIANNLSLFAIGMMPFVATIKMMGDDVTERTSNLASAIGALIGADFIGNLSEMSGGTLAGMGRELTNFATEIGGFITAMDGMKPETITGVQTLCSAINALTSANLKDTITQLIPGDNSLGTFGESIKEFAGCMKTAAESLNGITDEQVESIKRSAAAGQALADLGASIPRQDGWVQEVLGSQELGAFGASIVAFADCLVKYSKKISEGEINADAITSSATAAKSIAELNGAIPTQGGWADEILGAQDLATFGASIVAFADCLVKYSSKISEADIDAEAIKSSANAAEALATLNGKLPSQNGLYQAVMGEQNLGEFGIQLVSFATGVVAYANAAAKIDDTKIEAITNSGKAIDELIKVIDKIPETGGWGDIVFGSSDGQSFGAALSSMAGGIASYCAIAATIGDDDITAIQKSKTAVEELGKVISAAPETTDSNKATALLNAVGDIGLIAFGINEITMAGYDYSGLDTLKTQINKIGTMLADVKASSVADKFSSLSAATASAKTCATQLAGLNGHSYEGVESFKEALTSLSGADIDKVVSQFKGKSNSIATAMRSLITTMTTTLKNGSANVSEALNSILDKGISKLRNNADKFRSVGKKFITELASGISTGRVPLFTTVTSVVSFASTAAKQGYSGMYSAGAYLVSGFTAGISANSYKAAAKARAMANAAEKAAKEALDINSPSKVFRALGYSVPEGFAMGIDKLAGLATRSATSMATAAIENTKSAVSRIADAISTDIDAQPTIRPVLDLSNVRTGAGAISSMLGGGYSMGILANANAISTSMNRNRQNATNDDVVYAINKLNKKLDNVGGTTNNIINGFTYDDGSNVSEAIKSIARYAIMERRS